MRGVVFVGTAGMALLSLLLVAELRADDANPGTLASIPTNAEFSSRILGLEVYDLKKQDIGQIADIATSPKGDVLEYILSVGGFLGMGRHDVAVRPSSMQISYSDSDKTWHASFDATPEQLRAAPRFEYSDRSALRTCIDL